ncbi:unnamed protein product [Coregonus sp. 'balchen']|nr:unnamed protein product [Coregonus sp. 'balchen']
MLISLCYIYLWVRFQKCYTVVIRSTLHRLCGENKTSVSSFIFCALNPQGKPLQKGQPTWQTSVNKQLSPPLPEEDVFLKLGEKAIYITESQACDDISKWTLLWGSSLSCGPRVENISFIIEATSGQRVGSQARHHTTKKKKGKSEKHITSLSLKKQTEIILSEPSPCEWEVLSERGDTQLTQHRKGSLLLPPEVHRALVERRGSEPLRGASTGVDSGDSLGNNHQHMEGHGHHLHLSSCHECLELENSTILSVKYASSTTSPTFPMTTGDETLDKFEENEAESFRGQSRRVNVSGKPLNVLVYTGGCQERFQRVRSLLCECIDMDSYMVYPLRPQQALSERWLESVALLVLASDEPLTPQLQACFLAYLEQGGRVLGLSSTLFPTGLALVPRKSRRNQISKLSFTRADTTELDLSGLASGSGAPEWCWEDPGEVELWGELKGDRDGVDKDMVIVRVKRGVEGGEAVLTEILTSLGLSCELSQAPPPSHVYLLATSEERRTNFLNWLHTQVDNERLLKSSKASLKVVPSVDLQAGPPLLPEGILALVTDPPEFQNCKQFSLQTYSQHLETHTLGRTLLYTQVTPTTMDLLLG